MQTHTFRFTKLWGGKLLQTIYIVGESRFERLTGLVGGLEAVEEPLAEILRKVVHLQIRFQEETEAFLIDALMDGENVSSD